MGAAVLSGRWNENTSWEFYLSDQLPEVEQCSAVYCLPVLDSGQRIVLTHNYRKWEMPGGHIEPGETIEQALIRECMEEAGFMVSSYSMYAIQKVCSKHPVPNSHHGGHYPLITYNPFFIVETNMPLRKPTGPNEEILGRKAYTLKEISVLRINHEPFIRAGIDEYLTGTGRSGHKLYPT